MQNFYDINETDNAKYYIELYKLRKDRNDFRSGRKLINKFQIFSDSG